jgi:predicted transposase YdaD
LGALSEAARLAVEALMTQNGYQYQTEFARTYFARGKEEGRAEGEKKGQAEGKAQALLAVLEARGLAVSAAQRARIEGCTDADQLERWVRRAVTAKTTASLLATTGRPKASP